LLALSLSGVVFLLPAFPQSQEDESTEGAKVFELKNTRQSSNLLPSPTHPQIPEKWPFTRGYRSISP